MKLSLMLLGLLIGAEAAQAAPRAVSLDYCADQYLLKLAEPEQIAALSRGADKDYSYMRETAVKFPRIRATIEEAAPLSPDIILRQWGGGANAQHMFARFGAEVVSLGYPEDFNGVKENIRLTARALGREDRGEALIEEIDARLNALKDNAKKPARRRALYVTPGGVTAGSNTMIDAIINAAGLVNVAAEAGQTYWPALSAEDLMLAPPELIIGGFFTARDEQINYWSAAKHPALEALFEKTPTIQLPADLISCAAWFSVDAAEIIARRKDEQ